MSYKKIVKQVDSLKMELIKITKQGEEVARIIKGPGPYAPRYRTNTLKNLCLCNETPCLFAALDIEELIIHYNIYHPSRNKPRINELNFVQLSSVAYRARIRKWVEITEKLLEKIRSRNASSNKSTSNPTREAVSRRKVRFNAETESIMEVDENEEEEETLSSLPNNRERNATTG